MMLLESVKANGGIFADGAVDLANMIVAFAAQVTGELGGIHGVEALLVIGFVIGLLACIYEIKTLDR